MSNFRNIAPRPKYLPAVDSVETSKPIKTSKVAVACEACRSRRTKCNAAKPTCHTCMVKDTACEYPPPTAQQLAQAQKRKIEKLENDKSSMYEILWYLQTKSPDKATALLQHIRASQGTDIGAFFENFDPGGHDAVNSASPPSGTPSSVSSRDKSTSTVLTMPEVSDHPRLQDLWSGANSPQSVLVPSPSWGPFATVEGLDRSLEMFFDCVGLLFYIMKRDHVQRNIQALRAADYTNTPLGDIVSDAENLELATMASELAGMAALGVVHAQLADPSSAPPSRLADYFYAVATHGLDRAIRYNPLRAMKVAALVAMYNVALHAQVALAYTELGLSLARNHGLDTNRQPLGLSAAEFTDLRRTHGTLVHLQCWMSASLDYVSQYLGSSLQIASSEVDTLPEDMIRSECIKVTIIKASTLHRLPEKAPVPEAIVADFRARLSEHHHQLPQWMSLGQLLNYSNEHLTTQFRPVIFYVHMFYLSAMMLLSRRLIIAYVALDAIGKTSLPPEARQAIEEGYMAAQTQARMMELMLAEGKVVQVCWLCIYTTYTAGIMTAYIGAQKALQGLPLADDTALLTKCIRVLAYCAKRDALAGRLHDVLAAHLDTLEQHQHDVVCHQHTASITNGTPTTHTDTPATPLPKADILFTRVDGTSKLHSTSRALLRLTHRPFSDVPHISAKDTLWNKGETNLGTHLEWEWELKGRERIQRVGETAEARGVDGSQGDGEEDQEDGFSGEQRRMKGKGMKRGGAWTLWTPGRWDTAFTAGGG